MLIATGGLASAAEGTRVDLPTALAEFQLPESSRPVKELISGWRSPQQLVVVVDKPERTAWLQEAMPKGVKVTGVGRDADLAALLAEADALIEASCNAPGGKAPKLKWIHASSGGSDTCLTTPGIARGEILLTNSQKVKNTLLAEIGMGYVMALTRSIDVTLDNQRQRELGRRGGRPAKRLEGATMLIVGLGGAGTEIARIAHAMGMKVIATDPVNRNPPDFVSRVALPDELPGLLGQADVVMVAAPLTPATRGLFNAAMFARMKRDSIFVNWARADIVVAEDLAAALKAGTIGSAALNWATTRRCQRIMPSGMLQTSFLRRGPEPARQLLERYLRRPRDRTSCGGMWCGRTCVALPWGSGCIRCSTWRAATNRMLVKARCVRGLSLATALTVFGAQAAAPTTPAIAGVVNAGTPIEMIGEGYQGTEGPLGLPDGSLLFTENRAGRVLRIAPGGSVDLFLTDPAGPNAMALDANGNIVAVLTAKPGVAVIHPHGAG